MQPSALVQSFGASDSSSFRAFKAMVERVVAACSVEVGGVGGGG